MTFMPAIVLPLAKPAKLSEARCIGELGGRLMAHPGAAGHGGRRRVHAVPREPMPRAGGALGTPPDGAGPTAPQSPATFLILLTLF
jgi:hypothetical protein